MGRRQIEPSNIGMPDDQDDPSITNDAILWRRISPLWVHWGDGTTPRPQSVAFRDRVTGKVSVSLAAETTILKLLRCYPDQNVAVIGARVVRDAGCILVRKPTRFDPAHAIFYPSPTQAKSQGIAKSASWVVLRRPTVLADRLKIALLTLFRTVTVLVGRECPRQEEARPE
jgi:hypothetical protein